MPHRDTSSNQACIVGQAQFQVVQQRLRVSVVNKNFEERAGRPSNRSLFKLGGFQRLRDFGVPEEDLPEVAAAASQRAGNLANPRPATPEEILSLLTAIW